VRDGAPSLTWGGRARGAQCAGQAKAVVTLPDGVCVNPASADGLEACSSGSDRPLGTTAAPTCPPASRIEWVNVDSPLLHEPLTGHVHVAMQGDNPFSSLLAIYIVAEGAGQIIKLSGKVEPDPVTGRLRTGWTTIRKCRAAGAAREPGDVRHQARVDLADAVLVVPGAARQRGWLTPPRSLIPSIPSRSPVRAVRLSPSFTAGVVNPFGGSFSPFALRVERSDGQEYLDGLNAEMPTGLLARIKGVPLCREPQAAAETVRRSPASARSRSVPVREAALVPEGSVSRTTGYRGAPFDLSFSVPAIAGPYDLLHGRGPRAVGSSTPGRARHRDQRSTPDDPRGDSVATSGDPGGSGPAPLHGRAHLLRTEDQGDLALAAGDHDRCRDSFPGWGCRGLGFSPRLSMRLSGRRQTRDGGHPGLRAVLKQPADQANLRRVAVKLPRSLALDRTTRRRYASSTTARAWPARHHRSSVGLARSRHS
jgi:hypothetical protein